MRSPDVKWSATNLLGWLTLAGLIGSAGWLALAPDGPGLLVRNTLLLAAGTAALALPIGVALALVIMRTDLPGRRTALAILIALLFVPLYIQAAGWEAGFGRRGWWSLAFGSLAAPPLTGWNGALFVHALAAIPWVVLIVAAGLRQVPREWEEAALLEGGARAALWRVTLPFVGAAAAAAAMWVVVTVAGEITVADLYQVSTLARQLYAGFSLGEELWSSQASLAPVGVLIVLLAIAAWTAVDRLTPRDAETEGSPRCFALGRWKIAAGLGVLLLMAALLVVPVANLCLNAGITVSQINGERVRQWSPWKWGQIVRTSPERFEDEIKWTLAIGAAAASLALAIAIPLAWRARRGGRAAWPAMLTTAALLAIPGPLIGLAVIWLLNRRDMAALAWLYDRTILAPTLTMALRSLPLAILICWHALRSVPLSTWEAAAIDGAGVFTRMFYIVLPQRAPALLAAWLTTLAVATGDLAATILVLPPGMDTLSRRIFGLIHFGVDDQVAGICLVVAAGSFALAIFVMWLASGTFTHRRHGRRPHRRLRKS